MGGNAFASSIGEDVSSATFPRVPTPLYHQLKADLVAVLQKYYSTVICPPDAPEKVDHGDIDFMVLADSSNRETIDTLAVHLGAKGKLSFGGGRWSFAVPLTSQRFPSIDIAAYAGNLGEDPANACVQLDVRLSQSLEKLNWRVFKNSYGDLWQILGVIIRPYGLTANEEFLCVRVKEIEDGEGSKDAARIKLTDDVDESMRLLGLDVDAFHRGFEKELEVFEWTTQCRLFHTGSFFASRQKHSAGKPDSSHEAEDNGAELPQASSNISKNDRHRYRTRPMFLRYRAWAHANRSELTTRNTALTRQELFDEAIERYQKHDRVDKVLRSHTRVMREKALNKKVAGALMDLAQTLRQEEHAKKKSMCSLAEEDTPRSQEDVEKAEDQARKEIVTRLMRGLHNFLRIDENGLPRIMSQSEDDKENSELGGQPKRAWCESSLDDKAFIAWIEEHWRESDALEVERRRAGGAKAYGERQKKRTEKAKSET